MRTSSYGPRILRKISCGFGLVMATAVACTSASAATWIVEADPANPERRVEAAVAQAASGDTVLVGPGLYFEHIAVPEIDLTIIGRDGAQSTILDGEREFPGHEGSIIAALGGLRLLRLERLTFQHGQGSTYPMSRRIGGAVYCSGRSLEVADCRFVENHVATVELDGGAIGVMSSPTTTIRRSTFVDNNSNGDGGTLYVSGTDNLVISESRIGAPYQPGGFTIYCYGGYSGTAGNATIELCDFVSETGTGPESLFFGVVHVTVRESQFRDFVGSGALRFEGDLDAEVDLTVRLEGNRFWRDPATGGMDHNWVVGPSIGRIHLQAASNTFSHVDLDATAFEVMLDRNIFSQANCNVGADSGALRCNCSWPDSIHILHGAQISAIDNLVADPLLCAEASADLHIASQSPCAPENSPAGCGLIGALGVACESTPVLETSWGRIKHLMRGRGPSRVRYAGRGRPAP